MKKRIDAIDIFVTSKYIWHPSPQNIMSENDFIYIPMYPLRIYYLDKHPIIHCMVMAPTLHMLLPRCGCLAHLDNHIYYASLVHPYI